MDAHELGAWWPEVARRVEAGLASRGIPREQFADIVQEAAARALTARPDVADPDELTRWALTVALHIAVDRHRRSSRADVLPLDVVEPRSTAPDLSAVVEGRLQWSKTMRAMSMLSSGDRDALRQTLAGDAVVAESRRDAVRDAVRLHRARARLHAMVAKLGTAFPLRPVWQFIRKPWRMAPAAKAAIGTAAVLALLTLDLSRHAPPPRRQVEAAIAPQAQGALPALVAAPVSAHRAAAAVPRAAAAAAARPVAPGASAAPKGPKSKVPVKLPDGRTGAYLLQEQEVGHGITTPGVGVVADLTPQCGFAARPVGMPCI